MTPSLFLSLHDYPCEQNDNDEREGRHPDPTMACYPAAVPRAAIHHVPGVHVLLRACAAPVTRASAEAAARFRRIQLVMIVPVSCGKRGRAVREGQVRRHCIGERPKDCGSQPVAACLPRRAPREFVCAQLNVKDQVGRSAEPLRTPSGRRSSPADRLTLACPRPSATPPVKQRHATRR